MSLAENLQPHVVQMLARQIKQLAVNPPEGVRFTPSDSLTEVICEMAGPEQTPYESGTFTVKLILGGDFPSAPPKGYFITKIFHPNVANSGEICVNTLKKDWKPDNTLAHVFQVVRCLMIVPFPESSLNDDAGKLFMEDYDEYFRKAKLMTSIHATGSRSSAGSATGVGAEPGVGAGAPSVDGSASASGSAASADAPAALTAGKSNNIPLDAAGLQKRTGAPAAASGSAGGADEKKKKSLKRL